MMPGNEAVSESEPLDRLMRTLDVSFYFAPVFVYCRLLSPSKMMSFCIISPVAILSHSPTSETPRHIQSLKNSLFDFSKDYL